MLRCFEIVVETGALLYAESDISPNIAAIRFRILEVSEIGCRD
jgi:hypothetical protein